MDVPRGRNDGDSGVSDGGSVLGGLGGGGTAASDQRAASSARPFLATSLHGSMRQGSAQGSASQVAEEALLRSLGMDVRESQGHEKSVLERARLKAAKAPPLPLPGSEGESGTASVSGLGLPPPQALWAHMRGSGGSTTAAAAFGAAPASAATGAPCAISGEALRRLLGATRRALAARGVHSSSDNGVGSHTSGVGAGGGVAVGGMEVVDVLGEDQPTRKLRLRAEILEVRVLSFSSVCLTFSRHSDFVVVWFAPFAGSSPACPIVGHACFLRTVLVDCAS